jgi:hypothetical protein
MHRGDNSKLAPVGLMAVLRQALAIDFQLELKYCSASSEVPPIESIPRPHLPAADAPAGERAAATAISI